MPIEIDNQSKKVLVEIKDAKKTLRKNVRYSLYKIGSRLRQTASKNILKKPRQGRVYRYKNRRHKASIRGESWANRSGKARRGLNFKVRGSSDLNFGNTVDYVKYLEDTDKLNRPAMLISLQKNSATIDRYLNRAVRSTF